VPRRKWFKELKLEIKEKLEILENLKEKNVPDIVDVKGIRENEIFERIEEEWVRTVRTVAEGVDMANEELGRAFIVPEERPEVGAPDPIIEKIDATRISAAEARRGQEKHEFIRGHKVKSSKEAERLHDIIHGKIKGKAPRNPGRKAGAKRSTKRRGSE